MSEAELKACLSNPSSCATLGTPDGSVSEDNETKSCLFLEGRLNLLLMMYKGSGGEGFHAECAKMLVESEKTILNKCLEVIRERGLEEDL
eukprot:gene11920-5091_t